MVEQLIRAGIHPTQAKAFAEPLRAAMAMHDISTAQRQAGFIAQAAYESANFSRLEENLYYTTEKAARAAFGARVVPHLDRILRNPQAMANFVYAGRNGNGDEASGDGWRYRGRGIFQLTGRANYRAASAGLGLGMAYVHAPERVAEPSDAALTAAWFWRSNDCNQLVESGNFDMTTRVINGPAMLHKAERRALFGLALSVFE